MTKIDRWLLPDGIEEILPDRALKVERLRRRLLDLYHSWGYDLVIRHWLNLPNPCSAVRAQIST
jgi:ATP phosphoribosyltransferase involved in histidine biosynthesis